MKCLFEIQMLLTFFFPPFRVGERKKKVSGIFRFAPDETPALGAGTEELI
jgi:hypothetical protein